MVRCAVCMEFLESNLMWCCGTKSEAIVIVKCWYRLNHKQQKNCFNCLCESSSRQKNHTEKTIKAKRNACRCAFMRFGVCLFECLCVCGSRNVSRPSEKQICYRMVLSSYTLDGFGDDVCTQHNCIAQIAQNNNLNNVSLGANAESESWRRRKFQSSTKLLNISNSEYFGGGTE